MSSIVPDSSLCPNQPGLSELGVPQVCPLSPIVFPEYLNSRRASVTHHVLPHTLMLCVLLAMSSF